MGRVINHCLALALMFGGATVLVTAVETPAAAQSRRGKKKKKKSRKLSPKPKKGLSLGDVAKQKKSPERGRLDSAIRQLKDERYAPAAVSLYAIYEAKAAPELEDESQYQLAKALYRMGLNHSALHHFTQILSRGPEGKYYGASLEWCLFIARKIRADDRVLAAVAKFSDGRFPAEYKNEFQYELARYHYLAALQQEVGGVATSVGEARSEETVTGGKSIQGDVFGDMFDDEEEPEADPDADRSGGGLSIGGDLFGDDEEDEPPPKKRKKKAKKQKKQLAEAMDAPMSAPEHIEASNRMVTKVAKSSKFAARAKFLEAVLMYHEGRDNEALEAFKSVVRLTKEGAVNEDPELRDLAFFQLARTHFGAKQPSFSIYYYDKMRRFTYEWLEALYESSWAEFRLGRYEKALGNLLTLHSPFFRDQYFPESLILKAVVYYENCRYVEAKSILTEFLKRYEPVHEELKQLTVRGQPARKYYEILANLREGESADVSRQKAALLGQILDIALSDPELAKLDASYREVDTELKSLAKKDAVFTKSPLKNSLSAVVFKVRGELEREAGRAVKRKLEQERDTIKSLIQQAIRIDIETAAAEQRRIELTLRQVDSRPKEVDKEFIDWADDEKVVWPFEDEYWRDELGTYELTLARSCR